jgi:hypothetical protein
MAATGETMITSMGSDEQDRTGDDGGGVEEEIAAYRKEARKGFWKRIAGFFVDLFNAWQ